MHAQTNPLQRVYDCVRCACANSRTRHTKTRLEATLPFRTLEMQLQFSLHAGLFTNGVACFHHSQGSCICTSYTFKVYALAITLLRHAHAHMHALHNVHMRVPYVRHRILAKNESLADAALHGCSLTRRSNMA